MTLGISNIVLMPLVTLATSRFTNEAEWVKFNEAKLEFWVPKAWKKKWLDEDDIIQVLSPDEGVAIMFVLMEADNVEVVLSQLETTISSIVKDLTFTSKPNVTEVNGLPALIIKGKAASNGVPVTLKIMLIQHQNSALLTFSIAGEESIRTYKSVVDTIMGSVRSFG